MPQHLSGSQFITNYGPGAIIETRFGPRIIPRPDIGLFRAGSGLSPNDYVISDPLMTRLLEGANIFRLPSNAELRYTQEVDLYFTKPFPSWRLCTNVRQHDGGLYVLYTGYRCPGCQSSRRGAEEAIRFIKACPDGHMDDFDWYAFVHRGHPCQHSRWFIWHGGGGALSNITIECPECGRLSANLGLAWSQPWQCRGRMPENEGLTDSPHRSTCPREARLVQKQASNLRLPELVTLFSIRSYSELHTHLQHPSVFDNLVGSPPSSQDQLERVLGNLVAAGRVPRNVQREILSSPWSEIRRAISDVMQLRDAPHTYGQLIISEFHDLIRGSYNGIPPDNTRPRSRIICEIDPNRAEPFLGRNEMNFRVTPILTLRTVIVQRGYRREIDTRVPAQVVPTHFDHGNPSQRWYPGVEFVGEGLFVTIEDNEGWRHSAGQAAERWTKAHNSPSAYPGFVFRDESNRIELSPIFVWWHTLSHLLIRAIASEAGYSSASIRERVYAELDPQLGGRGGILMYATQPGTEGSLGGLIALPPNFQTLFDTAMEQLENCSCDPLCITHPFDNGEYNGAACYGCLLLSETSCEHRNMWLDRSVLLEDHP